MAARGPEADLPLFAGKADQRSRAGAEGAGRRGERLHALPALQECDPDRVRRRPRRCGADVGRRAAGRSRRPGRTPLRRAGRQGARPSAGGGGNRARRDLHHQRGEALQERAARQATPAQETRHQRDRRLPLVARQRARADPARRGCGARGDRGPRAAAQGAFHQRQSRPPHRPAERGQGLITVHPSYLLRLQEERDKRREFDLLVKDLHFAAEAARKARG